MFEDQIKVMEQTIIENLKELGYMEGRRKWSISKKTGIPEDVLTVLLKRLKVEGKVKLIMIWSESTGLPDGSGYCLGVID
jgi:DNA-binding transcriptional regulator LsrR (DeoR family)